MEVEAAELKLELKRWELGFLKKNGRKPTKNDAASLPEIKKKYDQFLTLKKVIQEAYLSRKVENKENSDLNEQWNVSHSSETILLPKNNGQSNSEIQTAPTVKPKGKGNCVWGENLLKKNTAKNVAPSHDDCQPGKGASTEKNDREPSNSSCNWRDNIRKNIVCGTRVKRLPSSLRKHRDVHGVNESESSLDCTLGLEQSSISTEEPSHLNGQKSIFGSQVQILKKNEQFHSKTSSEFQDFPPVVANCSPFSTRNRKTILSRPIEMAKIKDEDLSDLQSLDQEVPDNTFEPGDIGAIAPKISNVNAETAITNTNNLSDENTTPFKDETESFIEANFRDKSDSSRFSFSSNATTKINYDAICLDSASTETKNAVGDIEHNEKEDVRDRDASDQVEKSSSKGQSSKGSGHKLPQTNYIRLNMKKKCFSRRGGGGNFLRKQVFRQKLARKGFAFKSGWKGRSGGFKGSGSSWKGKSTTVGFRDKSQDKCYKCGETGHWASKCKGRGLQKTQRSAENEEEEKQAFKDIMENIDLIAAAIKGESTEMIRQEISVSVTHPLFDKDDDTPLLKNKDVKAALKMFKYDSFRPGQDQAISRILRGLPTLLVLSTGSGKSLCYQLPAYLYAIQRSAITLVISPLVSLMDDQVRGLPRMMKATRIHSGMTKEQRNKALAEVESGKVHVLLVSPEAITSWAGMSPKYSPLSKLPTIAFACVDECHCLSEWSHAFRPSYLRVCQVLRDQLGVKCLVGLTATATMDTCASVARQLGISDISDGVIAKINIPDNLVLSVSKDRYKDEALSQLLIGERFSKLNSVIVYCTRRDEASRIASLLRVKMQDMPALEEEQEIEEDEAESVAEEAADQNSRKRKRVGKTKKATKRKVVTLDAECYHAGMSASERKRIQNKFMNGSLRVVVATVAFGMGIDKQDVRSVIHYNMPMSFERYVQEVGRAGRDGKPAHCHLFLDSDGSDLCELSRHSYAKTMDRYTIKKFVKKVFPICDCTVEGDCNGHYSAVEIDSSVQELDVKREGLETLLCYLEIEKLIQVHLPTETKCTMQFYGGPGQMINTAKKVEAVALALKLAGTKHNETKVEFDAMKVADEVNMELSALKRLLRYLTYDTSLSNVASEVGKSGIEVEFCQMSFCVRTKRKATDEFLDAVTDMLQKRVITQENKEIAQLRMCFDTMQSFSYANVGNCRDKVDPNRSTRLKDVITEYFKTTQDVSEFECQLPMLDPGEEAELRSCIRQFLHIHANDFELKITGRAVARIFHGIDSPKYPATSWGSVRRFWRSKLSIDFNVIRKIATEEILGSLRRM